MHNVQIILAHNKQKHFQPKFPNNNMDNKKIHQQKKIEKKISPSKSRVRT